MASNLITLHPHEAQIQLEVSLREAFDSNQPKLTPPLKYKFFSEEEYLNLNKAIVYGVLCDPTLSNVCIKYLHAHVNDGYCLFIKLLVEIVDGVFSKLLEFPKVQLIWVVSVMIDVSGLGFDNLVVSLLRQVVGGDCSDGNLWLSYELVSLFFSKWDSILEGMPGVLGYGLYVYLRLLSDHYRLAPSPRSNELKQKEIGFCVRVLREQFNLCLGIGRDLIRLLQELVHIPEFRDIWRDLLINPSLFKVPSFTDVSVIYKIRTSSRYFLLRITPEMENQLRFLLTHVKFGSHRRHQAWFARKFLFRPERETLISDIVRFICCCHHPTNEVLQSEVIPRWVVIGWLLLSCTKKYVEASVKLALFYDWLFFDEKMDNVMNIEPAMLLIVKSIPKYVDMTNSLLEFLLLLTENYDSDRKDVILNGVSSALKVLVSKGVIPSVDVLTSCKLLSPIVRNNLRNFTLKLNTTFLMEIQQHLPDVNPVSDVINLRPLPCSNKLENVENVEYLIGKIGVSMKSSVEKILLLCSCGSPEKLSNVSPEIIAGRIKMELEKAGYKLFSPLDNVLNSDDEVQSITAAIIRAFVFTQNQLFREMMCWWSNNGCLVGARLLSYALRLAYEAHEANSDEITNVRRLLKFHIEGFSVFKSSDLNVDKRVVSKMIDDAYTAYKSIMYSIFSTASSKDIDTSSGELFSFHTISSSLWKFKKFNFVFRNIFSHLSDFSLGNEDLIYLLVTHLGDNDIVSIQIDLTLKRYILFGEDFESVYRLIRKSLHWKQLDQLKFWGLASSELITSEFPVDKLLLFMFFSDDLDTITNGIAFEGLMRLCNRHSPTPNIVGSIMLLPNNKFPDFSAAILSHWAYSKHAMIFDSVAEFLNKFENKDGDDIVVNQSALVFLLNYIGAQAGPNLTDMKSRLEKLAVAMDIG